MMLFGALYAAAGTAHETDRGAALEGVAREFSPRIEVCGPREITIDLSGLERLCGDARTIAQELRRTAADRGLQVRVAVAATRSAARLLVHVRAGVTVVEPGTEAETLSPLPLTLLETFAGSAPMVPARRGTRPTTPNAFVGSAPMAPARRGIRPTTELSLTETLRRWGLRTLGDFAALPPDEVAARLGHAGVEWQRVARGEDQRPLVPAAPEERFEQTLDLDWPIDGLEPLSFVLGRLMEPLSAHLERRDRGAAVLHVRLHLVTRIVHERSLQLPAPMRDARALRTLALLDLESHPPDAAIDRVTVAVDPTPGRVVQFSLITRPLPSPEQLSTLAARLAALMGEGRCGSPELIDSWRPGACAMKPFAPRDSGAMNAVSNPVMALRRFRIPIPVRVRADNGRPGRVWIDPPSPSGLRRTSRVGFGGGRVETAAGPWRTSGAWWEGTLPHRSFRLKAEATESPEDDGGLVAPKPRSGEGGWDRDEWDVALTDGSTYRLFRERSADSSGWFLEGIVD